MKTLALLATALLAAQAPTPTLLRRTLAADATDTYKIEDKVQETVKSGAMGEIPVNLTSTRTLVLRTSKVDAAAGTARFEATTTVDQIHADGPAAGLMGEKPPPVVQKGKLDVRGRLTYDPAATADLLSNLLGSSPGVVSAGIFVELPERAVRPGDTWDVTIPKNPLVYDQDQRLTATLVGDKDQDGVPVWVVSIRGVLRTVTDSTKVPGAKPGSTGVKVKGEVDLTGEGLVEKATGRTVQMTSKGASKATIELTDTGITLDTTGTVESVAKLQK